MPPPYKVAVIGAGPQGLGALKNLLEVGEEGSKVKVFEPTLFESRDRIGGLWAFSEDPETTTVLQSTLGNVCRWRNCYGDFPVSDEDMGPGGKDAAFQDQKSFLAYLERYVEKFGLNRHITLNARVTWFRRVNVEEEEGGGGEGGEKEDKWELTIEKKKKGGKPDKIEKMVFDKVIVATGQYAIPLFPKIEGIEKFAGEVIHSKSVKRPSDFQGKRVLIVGFGNTASDIAVDLVGYASKIYLSHRHGNFIFPRITQGKPVDMISNRRTKKIQSVMGSLAPARFQALSNKMAEKISSEAVELKADWHFRPVQPLLLSPVLITDSLVRVLHAETVTSVAGISRVLDQETVELQDGTKVEVDCVIVCTGYEADYSISSDVEFEKLESEDMLAEGKPRIPRLYQNIFPPFRAQSLAFINNWWVPAGICEFSDLIGMAIAQIWKGAFALPSEEEMNREIDKHRAWVDVVIGQKGLMPKLVNEGRFRAWLHDAAGTGVNENLGYGVQGWNFWLYDRKFCNLLMAGVDSPHVCRLFDGRRKKWDGAREAIIQANEDVERLFGSNVVTAKRAD